MNNEQHIHNLKAFYERVSQRPCTVYSGETLLYGSLRAIYVDLDDMRFTFPTEGGYMRMELCRVFSYELELELLNIVMAHRCTPDDELFRSFPTKELHSVTEYIPSVGMHYAPRPNDRKALQSVVEMLYLESDYNKAFRVWDDEFEDAVMFIRGHYTRDFFRQHIHQNTVVRLLWACKMKARYLKNVVNRGVHHICETLQQAARSEEQLLRFFKTNRTAGVLCSWSVRMCIGIAICSSKYMAGQLACTLLASATQNGLELDIPFLGKLYDYGGAGVFTLGGGVLKPPQELFLLKLALIRTEAIPGKLILQAKNIDMYALKGTLLLLAEKPADECYNVWSIPHQDVTAEDVEAVRKSKDTRPEYKYIRDIEESMIQPNQLRMLDRLYMSEYLHNVKPMLSQEQHAEPFDPNAFPTGDTQFDTFFDDALLEPPGFGNEDDWWNY